MKSRALIVLLVVGIAGSAFAQTGTFHEAVGTNYRAFSEVSLTHAQETAETLDALLGLYNEYLHLDLEELPSLLRVRIFSNKSNFDSYLASLIPQKRDSFVFLQYQDVAKSELLGFYMEDESYMKALAHHGVVQALKAFVPNPPLWLQKGLAVYFEKSTRLPDTPKAVFVENLSWVKTMKSLAENPADSSLIPLEELLTIDVENANTNIEAFYAESWALISFLAGSDLKEYNRMLWDTLSMLDPAATMAENSALVRDKVFSWVTTDQFYTDFQAYLAEVKTFPELVREGMAYYSSRKLDLAEKAFLKAIDRNDRHDIPYYYLGLINYSRNEYTLAEYYYLTSQQMGGDLGLTYYALGVNAYADNRFDAAVDYLAKANDADPFVYGDKSKALISRIEG
jgi:tetratricopeptide (TPR) repeat protein